MTNFQRWCVTLGIGIGGGLMSAMTDPVFPGWWDFARHVILGAAAVIAPLKMTLKNGNGNGNGNTH